MTTRIASLFALALLLSPDASAQDMRLPVFYLRYEGGTGWEQIAPEDPEKEWEEANSERHTLVLRIKEQWSDTFTSNLYTAVSGKHYEDQSGSYTYFYINPDFQWDLSDRIRWSAGVRAKWTFDDWWKANDLTSLLAGTELAVEMLEGLKLEPFLQTVFDLYGAEARSKQTYTAGLRLESRLSTAWRLSGRYRSIWRFPLGTGNDGLEKFNQEWGLNLNWDPNK